MKKKILIVEDNKDCREILGLLVTMIGYHAIMAPDSKEAIAYAEAEEPSPHFYGYWATRYRRDQNKLDT